MERAIKYEEIGWSVSFIALLSPLQLLMEEIFFPLLISPCLLWMYRGLWEGDLPGQLQPAGVNRAKNKIC